jgi:hypothetical protein
VDDVAPVGVGAGWAADCGVATVALRLVAGRRLVWAIDVDEKIKSSIAGKTSVGAMGVDGFIREPWFGYVD